jgi:hypothetical protein
VPLPDGSTTSEFQTDTKRFLKPAAFLIESGRLMARSADRRTMQPQSRPASCVEFEELANDLTADQSSKPSVLTKNFIRGVICGLCLSTIYWLLLAAAFMRLIR